MAHSEKQKKLDEILGRALRDGEFRKKLVENPKQVAAETSLTEEEMELVAGGLTLGTSLIATSAFSTRFNPGQVMFCTGRICNEGSAGAIANPAILTNPANFKK